MKAMGQTEELTEKGLDPEGLSFYLDFFRYGVPPHGGFGMGLSRMLMLLLHQPNLRGLPWWQEASSEVLPHLAPELADLLRDELGLKGSHLGCEHGVCGACTVLVDGKSTRACLMLAVQAESRTVETIEGLSDRDRKSVV